MLKQILILALGLFIFCTSDFAGVLWHCTATGENGAVWNRFASTHEDARYIPEKACNKHNPSNKPCEVACFPAREYWRCVSHDIPTTDEKTGITGKVGSWYWTSAFKEVAINGARDACRHNSAYGGCHVNPTACATS